MSLDSLLIYRSSPYPLPPPFLFLTNFLLKDLDNLNCQVSYCLEFVSCIFLDKLTCSSLYFLNIGSRIQSVDQPHVWHFGENREGTCLVVSVFLVDIDTQYNNSINSLGGRWLQMIFYHLKNYFLEYFYKQILSLICYLVTQWYG